MTHCAVHGSSGGHGPEYMLIQSLGWGTASGLSFPRILDSFPHWDAIPDACYLKEKSINLVHGFTGFSPWYSGSKVKTSWWSNDA